MSQQLPSLTEMLKAGVHFGHQRSRWHPKMKQYLFGMRNGIHVIDLDKTVEELEKSLEYMKNLASKGKVILFVGTKRQARDLIKSAAESCAMPYVVERWIGGLLTNFDEFKRRLKKYNSLKEMTATGEIEKYTKKEQSTFKKQIAKMDKYLGGLTTLNKIPDALYVADVRVEKTAVTEARRVHVPIVAICDSNVDPSKIDYPIPSNDDAVHAIKMMADLAARAIKEGAELAAKDKLMNPEVTPKKAYVEGSTEQGSGMAEKAQAEKGAATSTATAAVKKVRRVIKKEEAV